MSDLDQPSTEFIDLDQATVLKRPRDLTNHLMDRGAMQAYQSGSLSVDNTNPGRTHLERVAGDLPETVGDAFNRQEAPTAAPVAAPAPQFTPGVAQPIPTYQPPAQPAPVPAGPQPALVTPQPAPAAAPIQPADSAGVQARIGRLYGDLRSAQEERDVGVARIQELEDRVSRLQAPPEPTYQLEGAPGVASPQGGDAVSRSELNAMFGQLTQAIDRRDSLATSQNSSRANVERDFAQDLVDPNFRQTYETVLRSDRGIAGDPNGPEKAAIMARGLLAGAAPSTPSPSADVARRQAMSPGVGPSVPEGSSAPVSDQVSRYNQAMARAAASGRDEDFVQALLIQRGQA